MYFFSPRSWSKRHGHWDTKKEFNQKKSTQLRNKWFKRLKIHVLSHFLISLLRRKSSCARSLKNSLKSHYKSFPLYSYSICQFIFAWNTRLREKSQQTAEGLCIIEKNFKKIFATHLTSHACITTMQSLSPFTIPSSL